MVARSLQPRRIEPGALYSIGVSQSAKERLGAWMSGLLGFFSMMPYISVNIGKTSALQFGNVLSIAMLAPVLFSRRAKLLWIFALILAPQLISTVRIAAGGTEDPGLCVKVLIPLAVSLLTLVAAMEYAPRYSLPILTGVAIATVVHVIVGLLQWYSFSQGVFPLVDLYNNQSFLSVKDYADTIAKYIQRPFGLFPEPSAMACSLAPWALLWLAEAMGLVKMRDEPARWQRILFFVAAVGTLLLITLARSGHLGITAAATLFMGIIWFVRCKANLRTFAMLAALLGVVVPVATMFVVWSLSDRMGGNSDVGNGSWEERSSSLVIGWRLLVHGDLPTVVFGFGPGLATIAVGKAAGLEAIWSVLLSYIYETGLIGMAAVLWIAIYLFMVWKSARYAAPMFAIFLVWLVGITLTTSYEQLLSLWLTLGWLLVWPQIYHEPQRGLPAYQRQGYGMNAAATDRLMRMQSLNRRLAP